MTARPDRLIIKGLRNPHLVPGFLRRKALNAFARGFQRLPEGEYKNRLRSGIVRQMVEMKAHSRAIFINKGDTVVLVGTPFESRIHELARSVGRSGSVLVVEPSPENIERLRPAVRSYSHVTLDERAAWNEPGVQELTVAAEGDEAASFIESERYEHEAHQIQEIQEKTVEVEAERLEDIVDSYGISPDYLEVMVNGAELEVLKGSTAILESSRPRVLAKGHAKDKTTGQPLNRELASFLGTYGYEITLSKGGRKTMFKDHPKDTDWIRREGDVFAWHPGW